jgi:putative ABC transport system ATP-binding protein
MTPMRASMPNQQSREAIFACQGLQKHFGPTPALAGVDLDLHAGEVLALTGESGSGKSTLLLCMSGIIRVDSGSVQYGGRDIGAMGESELTDLRLTDFGFVFQSGHLVPDMPAVMNVAFPMMLSGARRKDAETQAKALLDDLGVGTVADRVPGDMSGGQSQRVAVARALVMRPKVIFADEPTGSLDSRNGELVLDMLLNAAREREAAILLVTHSDSVADTADRVVTLRDGSITRAQ